MNFSNLNKIFENKFTISKNLLKEEASLKSKKEESKKKLTESIDRNLTERDWKLTIPGSFRDDMLNAGEEEDFDKVKNILIDMCNYVLEHIDESNFDLDDQEYVIEEFENFIEELEYVDFEDEDEANYYLNDLYDLLDNTDIFLGLREGLNESLSIEWWNNSKNKKAAERVVLKEYSNHMTREKANQISVNAKSDEIDVDIPSNILAGISEWVDRKACEKLNNFFKKNNVNIKAKERSYMNYIWFELDFGEDGKEVISEDTIKQNGKWVNKGKEGTHGTFKTKKEADAQRRAMFASGFNEGLTETLYNGTTEEDLKRQKIKANKLSKDILYLVNLFSGPYKLSDDIPHMDIIDLKRAAEILQEFSSK